HGPPIGVGEALNAAFVDLATTGKVERDWVTLRARQMQAALYPPPVHCYTKPPARPAPARPTASLLGRYHSDYFGWLEVVERGGGLAMQLGPRRDLHPLRHRDGDLFVYMPTGENALNLSGVTFAGG